MRINLSGRLQILLTGEAAFNTVFLSEIRAGADENAAQSLLLKDGLMSVARLVTILEELRIDDSKAIARFFSSHNRAVKKDASLSAKQKTSLLISPPQMRMPKTSEHDVPAEKVWLQQSDFGKLLYREINSAYCSELVRDLANIGVFYTAPFDGRTKLYASTGILERSLTAMLSAVEKGFRDLFVDLDEGT